VLGEQLLVDRAACGEWEAGRRGHLVESFWCRSESGEDVVDVLDPVPDSIVTPTKFVALTSLRGKE
jgi:hypothetical protein